ncbi:dTDP-4-dehydrorhamnose reductase family protein [Paucibacter sp. M5-1]|uniref:dTDP-4-dehydrorhamnose reductase family protein n=1 Tax=Paucibacter sp. M5-1 TaxID=3015998 RepID=UPI0022B879CC|nr:SDR family oxidoreductase [Paucibacter sp. M5-1]MCZ7879648.1 SDR family oxidoreductase [Paucibacter sp. M5-1]
MNDNTSVLVIGASGMLGNAVLRVFAESPGYTVWGSARSAALLKHLPAALHDRIVTGIDVDNPDSLARLFAVTSPKVVVNCVGLIKQLAEADDPLAAIPINALLPHRLARLCEVAGARLVHMSTDCVFAGTRGSYLETDAPDATDLYGRSKLMGEVDYPNAVTLRTSIIGHELASAHGLVGWFLSQTGGVKGFTRAVFSGLPTVELARVIRDHVLPHPELHGLYHVSAAPIDKHTLLTLVAAAYGRSNPITPDDRLVIDRSLDSSRFRSATGYQPPEWPELVQRMRAFG